jgi:type IV pilus assembly protein PilE
MRIHFPAAARSRGFTLLELLVVIAIIGILSAIAYPAYGRYVVKGNRAAAQSYLMDLSHAENQFFADSRSYAANVTALGMPLPAALSGKYTIQIEVSDDLPPGYIIRAIPVIGSAQASDGILTIDNSGARSPSDKW